MRGEILTLDELTERSTVSVGQLLVFPPVQSFLATGKTRARVDSRRPGRTKSEMMSIQCVRCRREGRPLQGAHLAHLRSRRNSIDRNLDLSGERRSPTHTRRGPVPAPPRSTSHAMRKSPDLATLSSNGDLVLDFDSFTIFGEQKISRRIAIIVVGRGCERVGNSLGD